ncbi:OmpA/MotB family protein [Aquimarina muelleri]|uniref:Flagellar motor protein MotB n=1 Tax=Aquimarina muelleri TaxID=279356 RepID=A0A918JYI4_9FLAO|nr:flagellar motor protein MotB [Aquimarina muelleri]MCX2763806.1 flagellar motor protein MotB [Aquimarina muelleri]GGX31218.1 flagellar motor protein MotB [Aquimarina muelleri]
MKKVMIIGASLAILLSSCVSQKKFSELEAKQKETKDLLNTATVKLNSCLEEKASSTSQLKVLQDQVSNLKNQNSALLNNVGNLATLSTKEAENLEKSLESIKEKDLKIKTMQDALTKKDSVTLALVTSLKGALGNLADEDIQVNVEKGVVYVSISDKLLFTSGSYNVTSRAREVLGKVAKVVNDKPDIEFLVEGHTDNVPIKNKVLLDNWDLSVKRATSVVRVLQKDFKVDPKRMTAAGRSYYIPVSDNSTSENRAKNRRTRIVVLPKLDQFYNMIEDGMKKASQGGN